MGQPKSPQLVKLIIPMLAQEEQWFDAAEALLIHRYGAIDWQSELLPFEATLYYRDEMGAPLWRRFVTFAKLIDPGALPGIKIETNEIEQQLAMSGKRRVNLDPGYLSLAKLVLATTKNQWHRIYLGQGIYGEVTLSYQHGAWQPLEWTYPDYRSPAYKGILAAVRARYQAQLRQPATQ